MIPLTTTPALREDLIADEGLRLEAYADTGGVWTIGVGHTGPEVKPGLVWTRLQCMHALDEDIARVVRGLDRRACWWRSMSPPRQDVIANMAFNLGVEGLMAFRWTLESMEHGHYERAAQRMLASQPWRSQVGARAERLAQQMRTGRPRARPGAGP